MQMANLPASIQAQIDEADRIVETLNSEPPPTDELPPEENETNLEPAYDDVVQQQEEVDTEPEPAPRPQVAEPVKGKAKKGKSLSDSEETWEQRYRSLNGMYTAEVPRLHAQIKELTTQVQVISQELEQARKAPTESAPIKQITDEDREAFGPDLVDLIERAAESKVAVLRDREQSLKAELEALKSRLGEVTEKQVVSDRDRFLAGMNTMAPNWEALNVDQGFLAWLQEIDPIYGYPRQAALNAAYEALDANRVAQIFNAYSGMRAPAPQQRSNQELRRQVAPSTSRVSTTPVESSNGKIFSQAEIQEFYNDWRRGHIEETEATRIEREIHAAAAEGRIR